MRFIVQSDRDPEHLDARVEAFLAGVGRVIADMDDAAYARHVDTLVARKLEAEKTLGELCTRYWNEILEKQYHFARAAEEAAVLKTITKAELLAFYTDKLMPGAEGRRKLSVRARGLGKEPPAQAADGEAERAVVIGNAQLFKQTLGMHALPRGRPFVTIAQV
jgi:insulysin